MELQKSWKWIATSIVAAIAVILAAAFGMKLVPIEDPDPEPTPDPTPIVDSSFSAIWAHSGLKKIPKEKTPASNGEMVTSSLWDGDVILLKAAKNEVVSTNVVLEASTTSVLDVDVRFTELVNGDASIQTTHNDIFNYVGRNIELFYVRYLPIKGLSYLSYDTYDERHIPFFFRRPFDQYGIGNGGWSDRPHADLSYPEIAIPIEVQGNFDVASNTNQSIWVDIYIPKTAALGHYNGSIEIRESGELTKVVPVDLEVLDITLPDQNTAKNMVFFEYGNINRRYLGETYPSSGEYDEEINLLRDRHFLVAKRHRISLIDSNIGPSSWDSDSPRPYWHNKLTGEFFTAQNGYDGPGISTPNDVFSIGTYSSWPWKNQGEQAMWEHTDNWVNWFESNTPGVEYFLYLIDESSDYTTIERWASQIKSNPGIGSKMKSFATMPLPNAVNNVPSLDISASWIAQAPQQQWSEALNIAKSQDKQVFMYNGKRPATGSFATEDDGTALLVLPWAQYKKGIDRWFFWESTYYYDNQSGRGHNKLFTEAQTFGGRSTTSDPTYGERGWNHSNGDGVLFYPGVDRVHNEHNYGVMGPFVSLRMKLWRRGIQDVEYLRMAQQIDSQHTSEIISRMVPKVLWEYGVSDLNDPTWVRTDISWDRNPMVWENAREELISIIANSP